MSIVLMTNAYAASVSLAWNASTSTSVSGYRLYQGAASRTYTANVSVGNQITYTVLNVTPGQTYYFAVTAYDAQGNESAFSNEVRYTVPLTAPVANFTANPLSGPAPLAVTFTDTSTETIGAWLWDFGDGTTSTLQHPSHSYTTAGTYTVSLTASNTTGSHTLTRSNLITVSSSTTAPPVANFTATPTTGAAPLAVTFTNTTTGTATIWLWNFGDGSTSTAQHPSYTYPTAGTYSVVLTATGPGGSHTATKTNYIQATVPPPVAGFTATPTTGVVPLAVTFRDTSTGSISSWAWDFGNGSTSTVQHPSHTYTTAGTYSVRLTVSGPNGTNTLTRSNVITVSAPTGLVAAYSFENGSGTTVTDVSGSGNHGTIDGATWTTQGRFGQALTFDGANDWVTIADAPSLDLTTAMTLEAWVYPGSQSGWRTIIQKQVDAYILHASSDRTLRPAGGGTMNGAVTYTAASSAIPVDTWTHLAVTYDGVTIRLYTNGVLVSSRAASGALQVNNNPLRIGGNSTYGEYFLGRIDDMRIYNRALTAAEIDTDMRTPVSPPTAAPVANFTAAPTTGPAPMTVTFTNTTTGTATSWLWNFGDGTTSTAPQPSHLYSTAGTYTVALTATGPGGSHTATKVNYVTATGTPPVANFTAAPTTGPAPMTVTFTNTTTGTATSWLWNFGDGTTSTAPQSSHLYSTAGTYTVALTATGPGGSHTVTKVNYVTATETPPVANFTAAPTTGPAPLAVTFTNTTTGTATDWRWNFGDGSTSTVQHPSHTYTTAGNYTVQLTATGPGGSHSATKTSYIRVPSSILEVGEIQVNHVWKPVTFRQSFVAPIVVANTMSRQSPTPATVRVRNVTPTGFEIRVEEWNYLDGLHIVETVGYLVLERGRHTIDGVPIEAGSLQTNRTESFGTVTFSRPFAAPPVVLTAVVSTVEATTVTTRLHNITATNFQVRMQEQEKNRQRHATETLTYIALPPSVGTLGSLHFEAQRTAQVITDAFRTLPFTASFMNIPVFLAAMQTTANSDPAVVQWENKNFFGVDIHLQEEQSNDVEMTHPAEVVGYVAFASTNGNLDADGDGLTNVAELYQYGTDPGVADTDHDGINDGAEVAYWGVNWQADSDGDGLINLLDSDSGGHGILDGAEIRGSVPSKSPRSQP